MAGAIGTVAILAAVDLATTPRPDEGSAPASQDVLAASPRRTEVPSDKAGASSSLAVAEPISPQPLATAYTIPTATSRPRPAPTRRPPLPGPVAHGVATWYDDGPGLYGAVPGWRFGDLPYRVQVCAGGRCVTVRVRDYCACGDHRIIDLSPEAFAQLAPLSRGVVAVRVQRL
jgi:hypothetical protein